MCGRFTITRRDGNSLAAELGVPADSFVDYRPRYNVAPTQLHFIVRIKYENREVIPATWGLIKSGSKDASMAAKTINARSETIDTRGAFRDAFQKRRCVVPADGFFEWTGPKTARQPHLFTAADGSPVLAFAGLWDRWIDPDNFDEVISATIIVSGASAWMAPYHDRMPVLIEPEDVERLRLPAASRISMLP